jgi:hypothetical protein
MLLQNCLQEKHTMRLTPQQMQRDAEIRARLWQEFVANYQRVMIETPEKFEQYAADWRERYRAAH